MEEGPEEPVVIPTYVNQIDKSEKVSVQRPKSAVPRVKSSRIPRLSAVWHRCSDFAKRRDFESAYRLMLAEGDDMYLLRLIV